MFGEYKYNSHYDWLHANLPVIFEKLGINFNHHAGIIGAHGDKAYSYKTDWDKAGIHFFHSVAIYLLTYCRPYSQEVRQTKNGWVPVDVWVIDNHERFKHALPEILKGEQDDERY